MPATNIPVSNALILKLILFFIIGKLIYFFAPQIFMNSLPDFGVFKGPAKGSCISVILLLLMTILFLRTEDKNLSVLGLSFKLRRGQQLFIGIVIGAVMSAVCALLSAAFFNYSWKLNVNFDFLLILSGLLLNVWSVIAEELLYRGYLFKSLADRIQPWKAILLTVTLFAVSHWFAWGAWGNISKMLSVYCTVAAGGTLFCLAFLKTGSLALPIGLHLGFVWSNADLFTNMFARWYNNAGGLFTPANTEIYNKYADNWWLINVPYFVVLATSIVFSIRYYFKRKPIEMPAPITRKKKESVY